MGTSAMVERVAKAIDAALNDTSLAFTTESPHDTDTIRKCRIADTERAIRCARAAIEALRDLPDNPGPLYEAGEYSRRNVDCMVTDFLEG